jgi:hypothetical protein
MAVRIRSFLAVWLGRVERQHRGTLAHSSRWWLTTPSHPRTEDRWRGCGILSLRCGFRALSLCGRASGRSAECCQNAHAWIARTRRDAQAPRHVSIKRLVECFCARAAAVRCLSAGGAIEARSTAPGHVRKKPATTGKEKLGAAIRQLCGGARCTPSEVAGTVLDTNA